MIFTTELRSFSGRGSLISTGGSSGVRFSNSGNNFDRTSDLMEGGNKKKTKQQKRTIRTTTKNIIVYTGCIQAHFSAWDSYVLQHLELTMKLLLITHVRWKKIDSKPKNFTCPKTNHISPFVAVTCRLSTVNPSRN